MNPVTRTFNNPALEKDYLRARAERNLNPVTAFGFIGIAGLMAFALAAYKINDGFNIVTIFTVAVVIPTILLSLFLARKFFAGSNAFNEVATVSNLAMIALTYNFLASNEIKLTPFGTVLFLGTGINTIFLFFAFILLQLRFISACFISAVIILSYLPKAIAVSNEFILKEPEFFNQYFIGDIDSYLSNPFGYQFGLLMVVYLILASSSYLLETLDRTRYLKDVLIEKQKLEIEAEKNRSEQLLLNVLPYSVAERLKGGETIIADSFNHISVLFADICSFTPLSRKLEPEVLVNMLNGIFTEFDRIIDALGLEKIKTIGDAYMVVAGAPNAIQDHETRIANAALRMMEVTDNLKDPLGNPIQLRIGISSGSAVAGIIGVKKFSYDVWGDTVNTASRMESHGEIGKIHVTQEIYEKLKDQFFFEARGTIEVKGKDEMQTWWLIRRDSRWAFHKYDKDFYTKQLRE